MSCERCATLLFDLARGGLDPREAEEARAHLRRCPDCDERFRRVSKAHPRPARSGMRSHGGATRASATQILHALGRFAMGRQVAMGTLTLLIVAFGLWHVPQMKHAPATAAAGDSVAHSPEAEPQDASAISPAEPLDLTLDLRRGRIRSRNLQDLEAGGAGPHVASRGVDRDSVPGMRSGHEGARPTSRFSDDSASRDAYDTGLRDPGAATSMTAGALGARRDEALFAGGRPIALSPSIKAAEALHARAQRLQQRGRLQVATRVYQRLLGAYPEYPERAEVMLEIADCYAKRGRLDEARRRLQQVARHPRLREAALRRLARLRGRDSDLPTTPSAPPPGRPKVRSSETSPHSKADTTASR